MLIAGASKESREAAHDGGSESSTDAEVLHGGKIIAAGFGIGFSLQVGDGRFLARGTRKPGKDLPDNVLKGGSIHLENNPALLGVGYIIGPYIVGHHARRRHFVVSDPDPADQVFRRSG